ncbi:MAG: cytochrome b/b6 domain-containing protein [Alphaproteobacteria bacterium]
MTMETTQDNVNGAESSATVKVWDILVRVMHWSLVTAFTVAHLTAEEEHHGAHESHGSGPLEAAPLHELAGYVILGIVAARIVWGLIGTQHARFTDFIYKPSTIFSFLRQTLQLRAPRFVGHNPAGGAMTAALLAVFVVMGSTGYLMTTYAELRWLKEIHEVFANLSLILVGLHVAGVIAASLEHRENLVKAMFTGRKRKH